MSRLDVRLSFKVLLELARSFFGDLLVISPTLYSLVIRLKTFCYLGTLLGLRINSFLKLFFDTCQLFTELDLIRRLQIVLRRVRKCTFGPGLTTTAAGVAFPQPLGLVTPNAGRIVYTVGRFLAQTSCPTHDVQNAKRLSMPTNVDL